MLAFTITITGTTPLLMHNSRLSDPLDAATKQVAKLSSKRNKTTEDHAELARVEFLGSLYHDDDIGPYIPGDNILACLRAGAKLNKLGTAVDRGMVIETVENPLAYRGPRDPEEMWASGQFAHRASVKVGKSRLIRTRPIFMDWATMCEGMIDESQLDLDKVSQIAENSGQFIGLGDWRPIPSGGKFGRFTAKVEPR